MLLIFYKDDDFNEALYEDEIQFAIIFDDTGKFHRIIRDKEKLGNAIRNVQAFKKVEHE